MGDSGEQGRVLRGFKLLGAVEVQYFLHAVGAEGLYGCRRGPDDHGNGLGSLGLGAGRGVLCGFEGGLFELPVPGFCEY